MPKRNRAAERKRRERPRDLKASEVEVVGVILQSEQAWLDHEQGDECWRRCQ